mgnify:CR=1 FL=1
MFALMLVAALTAQTNAPALTPQEASRDLAIARAALERLHPGYDRYAPRGELDAAWAGLEAGAQDGADLAELYLGLSGLLADIRCDHTKAELPEAVAEWRETAPVYLPFQFVLFEGGMYVETPAPGTGLQRGEEILSLDGDPVSERLAQARRFMPVDGFTDHVRDVALQQSSEFLGSGFDQFDPLLNPDDGEVALEVRGLDGSVRTVRADRIGFVDYRALSGAARWRNFSDEGAVSVTRPRPGVAILNVETFVNYRTPVDPYAVFGAIFSQLAEERVETLIVDLRRNGGGSVDAQLALLAHLTREATVRAGAETILTSYDFTGLREYIRTWDRSALDPDPELLTPREDGRFTLADGVNSLDQDVARAEAAFSGDIILLTSRANSSGATQMIGALRDQGHVTLIGEATGGSQEGPTAGLVWFVELPESGVIVRVPWWLQISTVDEPEFGRGYDPDIAAPLTYGAWLAGRDPAMSAALAAAAD